MLRHSELISHTSGGVAPVRFSSAGKVNFETLAPNPANLAKMMVIENLHIYLK